MGLFTTRNALVLIGLLAVMVAGASMFFAYTAHTADLEATIRQHEREIRDIAFKAEQLKRSLRSNQYILSRVNKGNVVHPRSDKGSEGDNHNPKKYSHSKLYKQVTKPKSHDSDRKRLGRMATTKETTVEVDAQAKPQNDPDCLTDICRREKVKSMMHHAWNGYKSTAWGKNEVDAITGGAHHNGLFAADGATIVDALDTLYIMGMEEELRDAREWVKTSLTFQNDKGGSVFEITIRYLGGLLSAYALTGDKLYLSKAVELGDRLLPAFNTPHGIPNSVVNLATGHSERMGWLPCQCAVLAEMGTLNIEFEYLSIASGDPKYKNAVKKAMDVVLNQERPRGMFPNFVEISSGKLYSNNFRLGAYGDSFYEYLIKTWRFHGGRDVWNTDRKIYDDTMDSVFENLLKTSDGGHMYMADMEHGQVQPRMDHLACFLGGNLILASEGSQNTEKANKYKKAAEGLTETCHHSYASAKLGLGPDIMNFRNNAEGAGMPGQSWYWLRPETVESYFYMWRYTKDEKYRSWAWEAIGHIESNCKCKFGYCGLENVDDTKPNWHPTQESFFLAETLKYLYLIFSDDDVIPFEKWVFNTEAHPLPVQK